MLVIISDPHLTDGTSGTTIDADAFNIFREGLSGLAWAASDRRVKGEESVTNKGVQNARTQNTL